MEFNEQGVISTKCIDLLGYRIQNGIITPDPNRVVSLLDFPEPHNTAALNPSWTMGGVFLTPPLDICPRPITTAHWNYLFSLKCEPNLLL